MAWSVLENNIQKLKIYNLETRKPGGRLVHEEIPLESIEREYPRNTNGGQLVGGTIGTY